MRSKIMFYVKLVISQNELITFYILIQVDAVTTRLIYSWVINMTETNNYEHLAR